MTKANPDINDTLRSEGAEGVRERHDRARRFNGSEQDNEHGRARFALIWLDDIELDDEPAYLIEGLLPAGPSFGVTFGPPKSLKSFLLTDALLHIAIGKPYCGREVQQGAVVYITSEGVRGVKRRLIAMRRHHGIEHERVPFGLVPVMPNLGTGTADLEQLISDVRLATNGLGVPVRVIAIDTLRRAIPGRSENEQKDMSVFVANCETLARTFQCHVATVHHSPRSDDARGSGSNALDGAADCMWSVARSDNGSPRASVTVARMKDGEEGDTWSFELRPVEIGHDRIGTPFITGYVETTDLPAKKAEGRTRTKPQSLPKAAQTALRSLKEAISECGERAPASTYIPAGMRVTTLKRWRDYAYRRGISASEKLRARQTAFQRASEHLVGAQVIAVWDEYVWLAQ